MKRFILLLIFVFSLISCKTETWDGVQVGTPQFEEYAGVYRLYPAVEYDRGDVPQGYKPFYISHYGRHGSRYILFDSQYVHVSRVLSKAYEDGKLTPMGVDVYNKYMSMYPLLKGRSGELSQLGRQQHKVIAKRMYEEYPEIFRHNPYIKAESTMTTRTIMSMGAFVEALKEMDPSLDVTQIATVLNTGHLNPYSSHSPKITKADIEYKSKNAPWRLEFHKYINSLVDTEPFIERLFIDKEYAYGVFVPIDFMRDLYSIAIHMHGIEENSTSFDNVFTEQELEQLWECDNITFYIEKGLGFEEESRCPALAESMLSNIILEAELAIKADRPAVDLRFGHDGCLMGLYTLMELEGWNKRAESFSEVKNVFQSWRIPMAANLQLVLYKNKNKDVLVSLYHNEVQYALPLEPVSLGFYKWNDFVEKYSEIIKQACELLEKTK